MSTHAIVGAFALATLVFAPNSVGTKPASNGTWLPMDRLTVTQPDLPATQTPLGSDHLRAQFGQHGDGLDAYLKGHSQAVPLAEDRPKITLSLRGAPQFDLRVAQGQTGPHDDF